MTRRSWIALLTTVLLSSLLARGRTSKRAEARSGGPSSGSQFLGIGYRQTARSVWPRSERSVKTGGGAGCRRPSSGMDEFS